MVQSLPAIHDAKPLRGLFVVLLGFLVLTYLIAVFWHWIDARRDAETQLRYINSILVQNTRTTLRNYELVLESAGSELVAAGALENPERGRALAERLRAIDPGMAGFGLARPDGQLVLVSGVASGQPLPNLAQAPETRDSFRKSLQTGHIQPGRPYYMTALGKWVIPVRTPVTDSAGRAVAVMTAGYAIEGGTMLLADAVLPPRTLTALLRDDGYLQYIYPLPAGVGNSYSRRITEETRRQILALKPPSGTALIYLPRLHGWFLLTYQRIDEYGLNAGTLVPLHVVLLNWVQRLLLPTALLGAFLLSAIWAYRRAVARQAASNDTVSRLANWRQAVLDAARYSIISTDTAGTIVSFNAAAQRMLGYRPEEVVGQTTPVIFHDADELRRHTDALGPVSGASVQPGFDVLVARPRKGLPEEREWIYVRKDGSRFPVQLAVTALYGPDGCIEGFLYIAEDLSERAAARAGLRDSEARYRTLFEHVGDGIFLVQGGRVVDCNPAALALFGCPREALVGIAPYRLSPTLQPDGQASHDKADTLIQKALAGETPFFEWRHTRADGTCFDAEVTLTKVELGGEPHILSTVRDVTARKATENELAQSRQALLDRNESLRLINQLSARIHASLSRDDILSEAMDALQGLSRAAHVAIHLLNDGALERATSRGFDEAFLCVIENVPLADSLCGAAVAERRPLVSMDLAGDARVSPRLRRAAGNAGLQTCVAIPMIYNEHALGSLSVAYGTVRNFNDDDLDALSALGNTVALAVANARHVVSLAFQARHDNLTGLFNRSVLHAEFAERTARRAGTVTALFLLDLDRFKEVNDTLGHHIGDKLLTRIGSRITESLADRDALVCRLGGDEFAILLTGLADETEPAALARRLSEALRQPFMIQSVALHIAASIGVTLYPAHGKTSHDLLRAADVAMYQAKKRGTGIVMYDRGFDNFSPERLALAAELAHAVGSGELVLHYQPKIDVASRRIAGFEALVRWRNARLGLLYPADFIHLAEMNEVIHPFTLAVLNCALADKRRLRALGHTQTVAINLSARNLLDSLFVYNLRQAIEAADVPYGEIEFELTETALMQDSDSCAAMLRSIAALGIAIAVDDFGTGYSSLAYLRQLPLTALKIDRSFVTGMRDNSQDEIIVRSTVALTHNLGLDVIAEGVEDARTLDALREMGCDQAQGYYLSQPLPLDELITWLNTRTPEAA